MKISVTTRTSVDNSGPHQLTSFILGQVDMKAPFILLTADVMNDPVTSKQIEQLVGRTSFNVALDLRRCNEVVEVRENEVRVLRNDLLLQVEESLKETIAEDLIVEFV